MSQFVDQLKVWSATRDVARGEVDYDRLANAGTPGRIVLNNMLHRMADEIKFGAFNGTEPEYANGRDGAELSMGGTRTYTGDGHFLLDEAVVLSVRLDGPEEDMPATGITGVNKRYSLANEASERWSTHANVAQGEALITGAFAGPIDEAQRMARDDYRLAVTNPLRFFVESAERFVDAEGMNELTAFLGGDAMANFILNPNEPARQGA